MPDEPTEILMAKRTLVHHLKRAFEQLDYIECEEEKAFMEQVERSPMSVMDAIREGKSSIWDAMMNMIEHRDSIETWRLDEEVEEAYLLRDKVLKEQNKPKKILCSSCGNAGTCVFWHERRLDCEEYEPGA